MMKKYSILILCSLSVFFLNCGDSNNKEEEDNDYFEHITSRMIFVSYHSTDTFAIFDCSSPWKSQYYEFGENDDSPDPDWIFLDRSSGEAGVNELNIIVKENKSSKTRQTKIVFETKKPVGVVYVIQKGQP